LKKAVPALSWIGGNISSNLAFWAISDFLLLYTTESSASGYCLFGPVHLKDEMAFQDEIFRPESENLT